MKIYMVINDSDRAIIDNILTKFVSEAKSIKEAKEEADRKQREEIARNNKWFVTIVTNTDTDTSASDYSYDDEEYEDEEYELQIDDRSFVRETLCYSKEMDFSQFYISTGATRAALILDKLPYVIKFDFNHRLGHCYNEVEVYKLSAKYGIQMLLAEGAFYSEVGGIRFYIYKKIEKTCFASPYSNKLTIEDSAKIGSVDSVGRFSLGSFLSRDVYFAYDFTVFEKLCRFIEDLDLNDFHDGNYGFDGEKPVIYDYGGYNTKIMRKRR